MNWVGRSADKLIHTIEVNMDIDDLIKLNGIDQIVDKMHCCHICGPGVMFRTRDKIIEASNPTPDNPVYFVAKIMRPFQGRIHLETRGFCEAHKPAYELHRDQGWRDTSPNEIMVLEVMTI